MRHVVLTGGTELTAVNIAERLPFWVPLGNLYLVAQKSDAP